MQSYFFQVLGVSGYTAQAKKRASYADIKHPSNTRKTTALGKEGAVID